MTDETAGRRDPRSPRSCGDEGPTAGFTVEDLFAALGGEVELSADGTTALVRDSSWAGRTLDVDVVGALAYLESFLPPGARPTEASKRDALSYFDLELQEFTGTTPPTQVAVAVDQRPFSARNGR